MISIPIVLNCLLEGKLQNTHGRRHTWAIRAEAPPLENPSWYGYVAILYQISFCELRNMLLDTIFQKISRLRRELAVYILKRLRYSNLRCHFFARFDNFCWQWVRIFSFPQKILQFTLGLWQKFWLAPPWKNFWRRLWSSNCSCSWSCSHSCN